MNRKIPYDHVLILIILTLVGFGLAVVFSASSLISKEIYGSTTTIFFRQVVSVGLGMALMFIAMRFDYHHYQKRVLVGGLAVLIIVLLGWALVNPSINNAHRWIILGPLRFQPSELTKFVLIVLTAYLLVKKEGNIGKLDLPFLVYGTTVGSIILLILLEPDLGTAAALIITASLMLFLAGFPLRYYLIALLASVPAFYFLVYQVPYRKDRILAFLDPGADPHGYGYQVLQSLAAVGSGGLTGRGLAQSTQKLFFLPEPHTDFVFAVIGEETGLIGCATVLFLFILLFKRGLRIALNADTVFGTYLGLGIVSMICIQALINISVVLSLCPTKGIPLPFVSVGGSSMLVMLATVGVLLNISSHSRISIRGGKREPVRWSDEDRT